MTLFAGHTRTDHFRTAALLFGCFIMGVMIAVAILDHAETFPPKTFLWTSVWWAGLAVLLLANVAFLAGCRRMGRAMRMPRTPHE